MDQNRLIREEIEAALGQRTEAAEIDGFEHNLLTDDYLATAEVLHIILMKNGITYLLDINIHDIYSWLDKDILKSMIEARIFVTIYPDYHLRFDSYHIGVHFFESDIDLIGRLTRGLLDTRYINPALRISEDPNLQYAFDINGMKNGTSIRIIIPWAKISDYRRNSPSLEHKLKEQLEKEISEKLDKHH